MTGTAQRERSPEEITEIEKHKYFLSEKAGYDVGWEFAERDWEENHSSEFRCFHARKAPVATGISMLFKRLFSVAN